MGTYVLEEDGVVVHVVDGSVDGGNVVALLAIVDEGGVGVDKGVGGEGCRGGVVYGRGGGSDERKKCLVSDSAAASSIQNDEFG